MVSPGRARVCFIFRAIAGCGRGPGCSICAAKPVYLTSPMLQSGLRFGVFVVVRLAVCWIPTAPPVALTYSQYVVLGCSVTSSVVVNVIRW